MRTGRGFVPFAVGLAKAPPSFADRRRPIPIADISVIGQISPMTDITLAAYANAALGAIVVVDHR